MRSTLPGRSRSLTDSVLILGATMRLTRLITNDDLGQWFVKDPLDAWMHGHDVLQPGEHEERQRLLDEGHDRAYVDRLLPVQRRMRYHRYLAGLECPYCVGYWVGASVLGSYALARRNRPALAAWRAVAGSLALNVVVTEVGKQLDYWEG